MPCVPYKKAMTIFPSYLHSDLAVALSEDTGHGQAPGRIQLFPAGTFSARDGRPGNIKGCKARTWRLTAGDAAAVIAQWERQATALVVDYEHQTQHAAANGQPAPAAGWITSLEWVEGCGLYASVTWTDRARAHIRAGEYRYISPVFSFDRESGAILRLHSAALTNTPALDGMDAARATLEESHNMKPILAALGLPETADEAAALAALTALKQERDNALAAVRAEPDPQKYVAMATFSTLQQEAATLRAELDKLKAESNAAALAGEIEAALKDGRLTAATKSWAEDLAKKSPDTLKAFLKNQPPLEALTKTQTGGKPPAGGTLATLSEEERYVCSQLGISPEDYTKARAGE